MDGLMFWRVTYWQLHEGTSIRKQSVLGLGM